MSENAFEQTWHMRDRQSPILGLQLTVFKTMQAFPASVADAGHLRGIVKGMVPVPQSNERGMDLKARSRERGMDLNQAKEALV